jgi:hypothetical protein
MAVIFRLCSLGRIVAFDNLPRLYRRFDHACILYLNSNLQSAQSLGLHHPARPVRIRLVPVYRRDRHCDRERCQYLLKVDGPGLDDFGHWGWPLRRPHRIDTRRIKAMYDSGDDAIRGPQGRDRCAVSIPRLQLWHASS